MSYAYGNRLKLTIDGGSHDDEMRMTLRGFPKGMAVDMDALLTLQRRRAPGNAAFATARKESDIPHFLSGIVDGKTNGDVITAVIYNENQRSGDYEALKDTPRPSHADYAAVMKYGRGVDLRGGGHYSGRLTSLMTVAGGLCLQYLRMRDIRAFAHILTVGGVSDMPFRFDLVGDTEENALREREFPTLSAEAEAEMRRVIAEAKADGDTVGGVIECAVTGLKAGLGEHMFFSVEAALSSILFAIPAVKGVSFGAGFDVAAMRGSENNDPFRIRDGRIFIEQNNAGGILGGMTTGAPVIVKCAVKPTPSIAKAQKTVSLSTMTETEIRVGGRHDPCILPRAVPVVEAAAAIAILDLILSEETANGTEENA